MVIHTMFRRRDKDERGTTPSKAQQYLSHRVDGQSQPLGPDRSTNASRLPQLLASAKKLVGLAKGCKSWLPLVVIVPEVLYS